ncbi:MAG: hypothetical protein V5A38_12255 [Halolamina sp.]|uniref:hypothetical protein n=1 Tax=Halolamina sp. TaxID=1940283 RepID=UPI002FC36A2B
MENSTRRRLLQTAGALPAVSLTGCAAPFEWPQTATSTPAYEQLPQTAVYTADDVGIRLPESVQRVAAPTNADLIVLHGNPAVEAEQAVTWLAEERAVALLGDRAQETWLDWARSEAYRETFGSGELAAGDPPPHLLVAAASGSDMSTYRYSWSDQPSNGDIVRTLDDAMVEIANGTPA